MLPRWVMTLLVVVLLAFAGLAGTSLATSRQNPPPPAEKKEESAEVRGRKLLDKVIEASGGAKLEPRRFWARRSRRCERSYHGPGGRYEGN